MFSKFFLSSLSSPLHSYTPVFDLLSCLQHFIRTPRVSGFQSCFHTGLRVPTAYWIKPWMSASHMYHLPALLGPTSLHPQFFPMFLSHLTLCPHDTLSAVLFYFFHPRHPLCGPLILLPSIFPSIRVFSCELALHIRQLKCWSFSISPSNEYSGLISFRSPNSMGMSLSKLQEIVKDREA